MTLSLGDLCWAGFKTLITLDLAQFGKYEQVAGAGGFLPNARPTQPVDGRPLNEIDNQVNFVNSSISGVDFKVASA